MNHPIKTAVSVIGMAFITGHALAGTYTISDLGPLGGTNGLALGINISGQVIGSSNLAHYNPSTHAFLTGINSIGMTHIGILGGTDSHTYSINNNSGPIVGISYRW